MKKLLLLSAGALLSFSAMAQVTEPTLTQVWETEKANLPDDDKARYAVGVNGTIFIPWQTNSNVVCINKDGKTTIETGTKGWCATADEAGNIILQTGAGSSASNQWAILPAGKTSKEDLIDLGTLTSPDGCAANELHMVGRAIGNVMNADGGAFYVFAKNQTKITKFFIANGAQVADKTVAVEIGGDNAYTSSAQGLVQPINSDVNATDNVIWTIRSTANSFYKLDGTAYKEYALTSTNTACGTGGGDVLTLGGVEYTIEPSGTTYSDGFVIVDRTNDKVVYTRESTETTPFAASWNANVKSVTQVYTGFEKTSGTTANVYHFVGGVRAAMYTFEVPSVATAIESVAVDANAPVEYYNLQGVKVANPENGLFIKKQGNKATKVIL